MHHAADVNTVEVVVLAEPIVIARPAGGRPGVASFTRGAGNAVWKALPVVLVPGSTSRDLGGEISAEIEVALRAWTTIPCTAFRAKVGAPESRAPADDGKNVVYFHEDGWPAGLQPRALAQTVIHTDAVGNVSDADIHVNATDHRWSLDGRAGTADARAVLIHEIGHVLGLGHATDPRATMFASGAGPSWRSLEADDRLGACTLYPGTGEAGCEALPCPPPLRLRREPVPASRRRARRVLPMRPRTRRVRRRRRRRALRGPRKGARVRARVRERRGVRQGLRVPGDDRVGRSSVRERRRVPDGREPVHRRRRVRDGVTLPGRRVHGPARRPDAGRGRAGRRRARAPDRGAAGRVHRGRARGHDAASAGVGRLAPPRRADKRAAVAFSTASTLRTGRGGVLGEPTS